MHGKPAITRQARDRRRWWGPTAVGSAVVGLVLVGTMLQSLGAVVSAQPSPTPSEAKAEATAVPAAAEAAGWQYRTLFIIWDAEEGNWVIDFSDGTRTVGLDEILNNEGANGWELVAVVPEFAVDLISDNAAGHDVRRLRVFLKQPLP